MCHRHREQAHSYRVLCRKQNLSSNTNPLWERACSRKRWFSHIDVECATAIASRLAPTGFIGVHKIRYTPQIPCRSRACSRKRCVRHIDIERADVFASRLAPTGFSGVHKIWFKTPIPCGSGLARESGVSAKEMLDVPPPSRASSAPTDFLSYTKSESEHKSPVGASLLAKAMRQPHWCWICRHLREQALPLHLLTNASLAQCRRGVAGCRGRCAELDAAFLFVLQAQH